nr:reverse transcriptase domain-containing protein [Tanacetum cinerariifolium]
MPDQRTMAQLLHAPTEGYYDAIVVPAITTDNFELKHGLLTHVQNKQFFRHDKEDPHAHIHYFNKITSTLKYPNVSNTSIKLMLFPFSLECAAQIWLEKELPRSVFIWDDLVLKFINQFFPPSKTTSLRNEITNFQQQLHLLDTFYNALNSKYQDSLNSVVGDNFLDKMPRECLAIIENKSKVCYSRDKPVVAKVSTNASTFGVSPDVAELKDMVKALLLDKKGQNQSLDPVKAVDESYVTCGCAHSYRNCPATDGNVYRDNIQEFVSQSSAINYNQGNISYRPSMMSNQIRPPGFPPMPNNQNVQRNNQNRFIPYQNWGNNFNQGPVYQPSVFQPRAYQAPAYQALAPQTQEATKDTVNPTNNGNTKDVQPQAVQSKSPVLISKPVTFPISEPAIAPVSTSKPNLKASIPYISRRNDERNHEKANNQIKKFYQIFKDTSFKISFVDSLILMPKFPSTIKALIENKEKLSEMAQTLLNEHCSTVLLKKLPNKLGDPGKFLIPCDFPGGAECLALANLGASINLMPFSMWKRISLPNLTPTYMTLKLADRLISHPVEVEEDVYVKAGSFHFPTDFVVVDFDADPRVPLILRRSFLKTRRALIDVFKGELTLRVGKEAITFNLDQTSRYSANYSDLTAKRINVIDMACEEYSQEVLGFSDTIPSGSPTPYYDSIVSATSPTLTPFGNSDFLLEEGDILLLEAFLNDDPSLPPLHQRNYMLEVRKEFKICKAKSDKSSVDEPPVVQLKFLPPHLEYAFLEGNDKLPVIIAKDLSVEEKTALLTVLKSHKRAIAWKLSDIKGINLEFCTYKILMEEDFEPTVQHQRRVNPKIYDVIKQEDQEKTTFTCPHGTFAYRRMPFGLCNAPGTFQRCMMEIFHDMIEKTMEVFMDDFSIFRNSFQSCLSHLEKMLKRCEDTNLCLNWEKSHFMVKVGIVLGHKISKKGIKVDKAKVDVISKLPHPTTVKEKDTPFIFSQECVDAFQTLKRKLTEAPVLIALDWDMPFELMCDASDFAIGEALGKPLKSLRLATLDQQEVTMDQITQPERAVGENRASWSDKLDDALWAFRTAYKTSIRCTPYKLVYRKACHLSVELEHKAYWALKHANFNLKTAGDHRKIQINELNELRDQTYENSMIYKEKTKRLHDSKIKNRVFNIGGRVLLFNSRLKIFFGKLKSRWSDPYTISQVYPYVTVELSQPDEPNFKVNGHRLKQYFGEDIPKLVVPDLQNFAKDH